MIKLFIFDLDGVITSTSIEHFEAWRRVINERFNVYVEDEIEEFTKGVSRMDSLNIILKAYKLDVITEEEKLVLATKKNEMYKEMISHFNKNNIFKGIIELLDFLKSKNIFIALGSASKNGPSIIESLGIKDYFDYVVDPSNLNSKPSPDIFNKAMNYFNLSPRECVGVEDAVAGVKSIKSAGMYAIGIGDSVQLKQANRVFEKIIDIDYPYLKKVIEE